MTDRPRFDELPLIEQLGLRHAWGVFGAEDRRGAVNLLDADHVLSASRLVTTGERVNLSLPLNEPVRPAADRGIYRHRVITDDRRYLDDVLEDLYPQASSQWDALRHVRCREHGFYNGVGGDGEGLGVDAWAAAGGIVGRGMLLDVARYRERQGDHLDPCAGESFDVELLRSVADAQGLSLDGGGILLVRTGWTAEYRARDRAGQEAIVSEPSSGLAADEAMARFLWDTAIAAAAADTPNFEVAPGSPTVGSLHRRIVACLGIPIGELWDLEALAAIADRDQRWDFLLVSVPLYVPRRSGLTVQRGSGVVSCGPGGQLSGWSELGPGCPLG